MPAEHFPRFGCNLGSQHIKALEGRLLLDRSLVAREGEGGIGNGLEVLGHLALAKHSASLQADYVSAQQRRAPALYAGFDPGEIRLGGGKQLQALAGRARRPAPCCGRRSAARRDSRARQSPPCPVRRRRRAATGPGEIFADPCLGNHTPVAHQNHAGQAEAFLQLLNLRG